MSWRGFKMIDEIINLEWEMFDQVENGGGRANCQDDFKTFYIMRSSQFKCLSEQTLKSYLTDLKNAKGCGRNLIMEKYAWMMASTAPDEFKQLQAHLPQISSEQLEIINQIVVIQVDWLEKLYAKYPQLKKRARYIHTSEDTLEHTSSQTYLCGELKTYSMNTLVSYARDVVDYYKKGLNLNEMIVENEIKAYGYHDFSEII